MDDKATVRNPLHTEGVMPFAQGKRDIDNSLTATHPDITIPVDDTPIALAAIGKHRLGLLVS